jgi:hypothetical protein
MIPSRLASCCRAWKFFRCFLPPTWPSMTDWQDHLTWQMRQMDTESGSSSSCDELLVYESVSHDDVKSLSMLSHSSSRAWIFAWCFLPSRWFSKSDLPVQSIWQNLQVHGGHCLFSHRVAFRDFSACAFAFRASTLALCFCPEKCCSKLPALAASTWQMVQLHFIEGDCFLAWLICVQ